jgi:hypothetical protein
MTELMDPELVEALDLAHIIWPNVEVGEKALTLCGLEWKVTVRWSEIPSDYPICRDCVNTSLAMLTESVESNAKAVRYLQYLTEDVKELTSAYSVEDSLLLTVLETANEYDKARREKANAKIEKKIAKAERKAQAEFEAAFIENQGDRLPDVPDPVYRDAVEVRMLRAKGLSWDEVSDVLDLPVDECKGAAIIAFGSKPKKG